VARINASILNPSGQGVTVARWGDTPGSCIYKERLIGKKIDGIDKKNRFGIEYRFEGKSKKSAKNKDFFLPNEREKRSND